MRIDWNSVPKEDVEKLAFLAQVRSITRDEFLERGLSCFPVLKNEGGCIRKADFFGLNSNGYDLFDSDEERIGMLNKYGIK